jgi:tRNA (guanine37-N1)-methyltransferase
MSQQAICLKVPKRYGEKILVLASKLAITNKEMKIDRDEKSVWLPLLREPSNDVLQALREQAPELELSTHAFQERKEPVPSLPDLLAGKLPTNLLGSLPHSADLVGDITVIEIPRELSAYEREIGEAILKANKNVQTVLGKAGAIGGTYRVRSYNVLAGKPKTETVHKEYGCQYCVDIAKAYFSPRLSNEHNRVATLVKEGETVVDLFAGVGPFAMRIAKAHENVKVYAIDVNPNAVEYLKRNIRLNRVEGKVHALLGDARQIVNERLAGFGDRVIMNLPEGALNFVDVACTAIKPSGGTVHFYGFVSASEPMGNMKLRFIEAVEKCGRRVQEPMPSKLVRATAPYEWQVVLDARIS